MHQPNGVSGRQAEQSMFFSFLVSMQVSTQEDPLSGEMIIPDGRNVLILFSVHTREQSWEQILCLSRERAERTQ